MKKRLLITFTDASLYVATFVFLLTILSNQYFLTLLVFGPILALSINDYLKARKAYA